MAELNKYHYTNLYKHIEQTGLRPDGTPASDAEKAVAPYVVPIGHLFEASKSFAATYSAYVGYQNHYGKPIYGVDTNWLGKPEGQIIVKTNLGNKIDITPANNHYTVIKKAPIQHLPNSSIDILDEINGEVRTRRYYDSKGNVFRDVDMDDHGNLKLHPEYPHEHKWHINPKGQLIREK